MNTTQEKLSLAEKNILKNLEIIDTATRRKALKIIKTLKKENITLYNTDYYKNIQEKIVSDWFNNNSIINFRLDQDQVDNETIKRKIIALDALTYKKIKITTSINMKLFSTLNNRRKPC